MNQWKRKLSWLLVFLQQPYCYSISFCFWQHKLPYIKKQLKIFTSTRYHSVTFPCHLFIIETPIYEKRSQAHPPSPPPHLNQQAAEGRRTEGQAMQNSASCDCKRTSKGIVSADHPHIKQQKHERGEHNPLRCPIAGVRSESASPAPRFASLPRPSPSILWNLPENKSKYCKAMWIMLHWFMTKR